MSVRAVVPRADGGVFVVVVLAALVVGPGVVHPVGEVGLQALPIGTQRVQTQPEEKREEEAAAAASTTSRSRDRLREASPDKWRANSSS